MTESGPEKSRSFKGKALIPILFKCIIVILIISPVILLLINAIEQAMPKGGPRGEMIPSLPPDPSNRIMHKKGLSIIAPENWVRIRDYDGPDEISLSIAARVPSGKRYISFISVRKLSIKTLTDIEGYKKTTFQEDEAYEKMAVDRESTFDEPAYSSYSMYVNRSGEWWWIHFYCAKRATELPKEIRKYIETIKFPESPAAE